ncbi:hypothetical protein DFH09DRAFT_1270753 [Mycena vulgaris]|nr:hypothetical protein DFH09DRAFT_1270753 [Mycena vulgaris]
MFSERAVRVRIILTVPPAAAGSSSCILPSLSRSSPLKLTTAVQRTANVFFGIHINVKPSGRIVFKLYDSDVPRTARNFCELATGVHGFGYAGSEFHRVIPQGRGVPLCPLVDASKLTTGIVHAAGRGLYSHNGMGGKGIYGETFAAAQLARRDAARGDLEYALWREQGNVNDFQDSHLPPAIPPVGGGSRSRVEGESSGLVVRRRPSSRRQSIARACGVLPTAHPLGRRQSLCGVPALIAMHRALSAATSDAARDWCNQICALITTEKVECGRTIYGRPSPSVLLDVA